MSTVNAGFLEEVSCSEGFNAYACMHCGLCTAICPMGFDLLPRRMFRYVMLGLEEKVVENAETIFSCLLCKMCEENCPGGVHIVENIMCLRCYLNREVYGLAGAGRN
jgi:heterodisulfide reductase subunit C